MTHDGEFRVVMKMLEVIARDDNLEPLRIKEDDKATIAKLYKRIQEDTRLVILVHGIRTRAFWYHDIRPVLEQHGFKVEVTNYGRYDLFRFLMPFPALRQKAVKKVFEQVRQAKVAHPSAERPSFIAHSFGTFIVARILKDEFDFRADRVIFCGSVVRYDFPFEQVADRFRANILNEVGTRDYLPVLAQSATWGYGSAGTYGFHRPLISDRRHRGVGHSGFLAKDFCEKFWVPFLQTGKIVPGEQGIEKPPWWALCLSVIPIKYAILVALATSIAIWLAAYTERAEYILKPWTDAVEGDLSGGLVKPNVERRFSTEMADTAMHILAEGTGRTAQRAERRGSVWVNAPDGGPWGTWREQGECPEGVFASAVRIKVESGNRTE